MKAAQGQQQCVKDTAVAHIQSASTSAVLPTALSTALFGDDYPVQQCYAADRYCTECKVLFKDADALADHTIMEHASDAVTLREGSKRHLEAGRNVLAAGMQYRCMADGVSFVCVCSSDKEEERAECSHNVQGQGLNRKLSHGDYRRRPIATSESDRSAQADATICTSERITWYRCVLERIFSLPIDSPSR